MHALHTHGPTSPDAPHTHGPTPDAPATAGRLIRWARFYDPLVWLMTLGQTRKLRALPLDLAALRPGERVLEIGCGTGAVALPAARRVGPGGRVVGLDAAPEMIAEARRKARRAHNPAQFRVEPAEALSFPAGSFDVALSSLMMHHLPGDLKRRALIEIRRVLRPGGRVIIVDFQPNAAPLRLWQPGGLIAMVHKRRAPTGTADAAAGLPALAALLRDTGFTGVETGPTRSAWIGYARGEAPG
jgi:demethylmenaquinone methyltransferase/2-methoxy-6-polyprenyl-1,4-benzoquinol methylase/phosphoethanolamine N-methyltransferase